MGHLFYLFSEDCRVYATRWGYKTPALSRRHTQSSAGKVLFALKMPNYPDRIMKIIRIILASLGFILCTATQADVYELRTYTSHEGRLEALLERFENHTMRLFEKHGIHNIAYWLPQNEELAGHTLIYIVSHPDRESAAANWRSFATDPEWQQVAEESQRDGEIVESVQSVYMESTPWSPMQ